MKVRALMLVTILIPACNTDDLTSASGPLSVTIANATIARGESVRAVVTNRSDHPLTVRVSGCRNANGPYQQRVGREWVDRFGPDTLPCQPISYDGPLQPRGSVEYNWAAPADTGTYRLTLSLGGYPVVSPAFIVR